MGPAAHTPSGETEPTEHGGHPAIEQCFGSNSSSEVLTLERILRTDRKSVRQQNLQSLAGHLHLVPPVSPRLKPTVKPEVPEEVDIAPPQPLQAAWARGVGPAYLEFQRKPSPKFPKVESGLLNSAVSGFSVTHVQGRTFDF